MAPDHVPLEEALKRLFQRTAHGIKPGLEIERLLLAALGNPHEKLPAIQVAGTNGKGSVCAMLEPVLRAHGLKTGMYTSPHLLNFRERFRVDGEVISEADLAELLDELESIAEQVASAPHGRQATFFEISTALAFEYFRRESVDIVILETGMGGTWDATNVASPIVSLVTRIDVDHVEYLGSEIEAIAGEKSGIIKAGRPAVVGSMPKAAWEVVRSRAKEVGSRIIPVEEQVSIRRMSQDLDGQKLKITTADGDYPPVVLSLLGAHQVENCAIVVAAAEVLASVLGIDVRPDSLCDGLASVRWPGRCQVLEHDPIMIVDGAHNPCGAERLANTLEELAAGRGVGMIVGFLKDKDATASLRWFSRIADHCWVVPVQSDRAMPVDDVVMAARSVGLDPIRGQLREVLEQAELWAADSGGLICVAGSLYLAGEVLRLKNVRTL